MTIHVQTFNYCGLMVATPPLLSIVIISFICFNLGRLQLFPLPWTPLTGTMPASIRLPSPPSSEKTSSPAQRLFSQLLAAVGLYPQVLFGNSHLCVSLQQEVTHESHPNSPVPSIHLRKSPKFSSTEHFTQSALASVGGPATLRCGFTLIKFEKYW